MMNNEFEIVVRDVMEELSRMTCFSGQAEAEEEVSGKWLPLKDEVIVPRFQNPKAMESMIGKTSARIGIGKTGARLKTETLLKLRADHAVAVDSVFLDVSEEYIEKMGLFQVQTRCSSRQEHLTRPDLGRAFDEVTEAEILQKCKKGPDVQIFVADGLSSKAIDANLDRILPTLTDALKGKGLTTGTPFFVKYGRVGSMDQVSKLLGSKVTCLLVGERPGLGSAESMSAYVAYGAYPGMPESNRSVVSNIHKGGLTAVEAGAYLADLIEMILNQKVSGVDLKK